MDDNYGAGYQAGLSGTSAPSGGQGFAHDQGYVDGKRARESRDGPPGVGIGILFLSFALCWLYPMVGLSVASVGLIFYLGADTFPRAVLLGLIGLAAVAWFLGFSLERRVSRFRSYRVLRDCVRWAVGLYPFVLMLTATGRNVPEGGTMVGYLVVFAFCFWLVKRADRVFGFSG